MGTFSSKAFRVSFSFAIFSTSLLSFQNCSKMQSANQKAGFYSLVSTDLSSLALGVRLSKFDQGNSGDNIDLRAPDCVPSVLQGYKCLDRQITTSEGKTYGVRFKWNRTNQASRGSFISVGGGGGIGEALDDATFKKIVQKLDTEDQVRAIFVEFTDGPKDSVDWSGCWSNSGGYYSAGLMFRDLIKLIVDDLKIPRGQFLNYLGLSNGGLLISYGMSKYNLDSYFDRVVMHAGPVMASAVEACDPNNPNSIRRLNTKERADYLLKLFSQWLNGDKGPDMCTNINNDDRMSVLPGKRNFPNTDIVTVIGGLEDKLGGFGAYHKVSNQDWINKITAKSKQRFVPEFVGHNYDYANLRRFLKIGKDQTPQADVDCIDQINEVCESGTTFKHVRLACTYQYTDYVMQGAGYSKVETDHYKMSLNKSCQAAVVTPQPTPVQPVIATPKPLVECSSVGQFTNTVNGDLTSYKCDCPAGVDMSGWVNVGGGCYHKVIQVGAQPVVKAFQFTGAFYGNGIILTKREVNMTGAGPNAKICLGRYSVSANSCVNDSEFSFMRDHLGAGGYYDANSDRYVVSEDLTPFNFPYEKYFAVFIIADGSKKRVELQPIYTGGWW